MVRALLDGTKTQTRRIVKPQPTGQALTSFLDGKWLDKKFGGLTLPRIADLHLECPYGKPGDRLWVRETFALSVLDPDGGSPQDDPENYDVLFRATDTPGGGWTDGEGNPIPAPWKPSIHMPRWACRLVLEIVEVRVERLQDISAEDATAEGLPWQQCTDWMGPGNTRRDFGPKDAYRALWEQINGAASWDANPWVWCLSFRVADENHANKAA